jgi:anti-sigma regulatory factor (Ser/Thr protein kinase)
VSDRPDDTLDLPAVPASVRVARDLARDAAAGAGMGAEQIDAVALAVTEACTNVVVHAYDDLTLDARVWISATLSEGGLIVPVQDQGRGLVSSDGGRGLGAGLPLMAALSDQVEYEDDGGTRVTMRFMASRRCD